MGSRALFCWGLLLTAFSAATLPTSAAVAQDLGALCARKGGVIDGDGDCLRPDGVWCPGADLANGECALPDVAAASGQTPSDGAMQEWDREWDRARQGMARLREKYPGRFTPNHIREPNHTFSEAALRRAVDAARRVATLCARKGGVIDRDGDCVRPDGAWCPGADLANGVCALKDVAATTYRSRTEASMEEMDRVTESIERQQRRTFRERSDGTGRDVMIPR